MSIENVAAAVVNFQTPDLLDTAVRSFHRAYPDVPLLVIDNGSADESPAMIRVLQRDLGPHIRSLLLPENRFHGPAMDLAMRELETRFVFVFDSDTETRQAGFLEKMTEVAARDHVYGVGKIAHVNKRGFAARAGVPVLVSAYMLLDRPTYLRLPPFVHHGLPALQNFRAAAEQGLRLEAFPIDDYVEHFGRGTAERFGYGLGMRSRIDYLLNRLGL